MKIDIQNVHFKIDDKIRDHAVAKIGRLEKYFKNIIKASLVFEKHEGDTANVRYCFKVELDIPGDNIMVEECGKNIFKAINQAERTLKSKLLKEKERLNPNKIHKARRWVRDLFNK